MHINVFLFFTLVIFLNLYICFQGYVGSFLGDGFGSAGLVHQIASEMKQVFPGILKDKRLVQVRLNFLPMPQILTLHTHNLSNSIGMGLQI